MALSQKQQVWIDNYLICWNATEAGRRAGYAFPNVEGPKNLVNPSIQAQIDRRLAELKMTADEVLVRLARIGRANIADFAHIQSDADLGNLGDDGTVIKKFKRRITRTQTGGEYEEIELELYPADVNLERIGKHLGLFNDRVEHTGPGGGPIEFTQVEVQLERSKPVED